MSIANYITFTRLLISPIFMLVYLEHEYFDISTTFLPYVLLCLLIILELSDAFDGYLARKYNQVTDLGKIFDPMADSIARISIFLTFTQAPVNLPLPWVFIFLYRDSVVSTLRTICALKGFALAARLSGKIKAIVQGVAAFIITTLMIPHSLGYIQKTTLHDISTWIVAIASIYTIFSGIDYIYSNLTYIKLMFTLPSNKKKNEETCLVMKS